MNLTGRPVYQKGQAPVNPRAQMRKISAKKAAQRQSDAGKAGRVYMGEVSYLPCCICEAWGMRQNSPTEVHHWKSGRHGNLRTPDTETLPLCHSHHNKLIPYPGDEDKIGFHNDQEKWEALYGPDTDYIAITKDRIEGNLS